ncbi:hypothetical protein PIB30_074903 [Stylosanthes scabra]|uniref:Uncharacterized protein n=1 Tax=Stylosanthes scabra TaxID=79078 RepID=A0ABU6TQM2_9FABA|nr:hypothetical protein [Stylosanthes scabra]
MPRMKKTQKRSREGESSVEPPPSDHPLAKWFHSNTDLIFYELRFAGRKEIPPRTLLYLVTYVLEPRVTGHGNVAEEDFVLMWAMVNEIKLNWPYLILNHMLRIKGKDTSRGIGYLCLWTRIFNHLGIDVSNEIEKNMNVRSEINESTLHHMGRGKEVQEEEQVSQMPFRGHPGPSSSSHKEPTMSDLMQVLQSIEQNMDQRFQRIEDNQTRMDRRLQRMEHHMRIQEDEDEDQE